MTDTLVSHKGTVVSVGANLVSVEIVCESACASCHAAGLCGAADSKRKIIEVRTADSESWTVGQEVEVFLSRRKGLKAVLYSYVIPLAVLMIIIVSLSETRLGELAVGLISLGGVSLYYFILYLFRDSLAGDYEFCIKG